MQEPDITDTRWHEGLHGRHAETLNGAGGSQRPKGSGFGGPEAGHHQADRRGDVDGALPYLDGEGIAEQ